MSDTYPVNYKNPTIIGLIASATLTVLVILGSHFLLHFDPRLFGYAIASVVAVGAIAFRYALWLQRPATRTYWKRGWQLYLNRHDFAKNNASAARSFAENLIGQRFIFKRGFTRWLMHFLIMWGCILSAMVTFPLVFGWVHFELEGDRGYRAHLFGIPLQMMEGRSPTAWLTFHALDITALMVIAGCAIAIHRRLHDKGAIALQQFLLDFVPHLLLIAISITGLMLTASSMFFEGYMYSFITLSHEALVIMTLFFLPFGKLFHIVQRPASIGVELYQNRSKEMPQAKCKRCKVDFASEIWLGDLKEVVEKVGFDYTMENGEKLQDYCPRCKRVMRGLAYADIADRKDKVFSGSRAENQGNP